MTGVTARSTQRTRLTVCLSGVVTQFRGLPPGMYEPHMECLCGAQFTAPTWAEVGAAMDEHIEAVGADHPLK